MSNTISPRVRGLIREAVGRAIREAVAKAPLSLDAFATLYGVSEDTVKRWAKGDGYPNYATALRLAPLVGVDPETGRKVKS